MRLSLSDTSGQFKQDMVEAATKIATAVTATIREAGEIAKSEGRANIASAGFPARWQTGLDVKYYPLSGKPSVRAAAIIYHKNNLASVFEDGKTIVGKPLLWLPIEANLPPGRWTPKKYAAQVGPLRSLNRPGRKPLLISAPVRSESGRDARLKILGKTAARGGVPLFVGVKSVTIQKRFDIARVVDGVRARLPELYKKNSP